MVEGKIDAPRPHAQLQLRKLFYGSMSYLIVGALALELVPAPTPRKLYADSFKSPQCYNGSEVESQVVRPVGK